MTPGLVEPVRNVSPFEGPPFFAEETKGQP